MVELENIVEKINRLPNSFCIIGDYGSGKHKLLNCIFKKFFQSTNSNLIDITETLSDELVTNIILNPIKNLYYVDINKTRNISPLLKLLEEPVSSCYVGLLVRNESSLINTISNRVIKYTIPSLSIEELKSINNNIKDEYFNTILVTKGDIERINTDNIDLDKIEKLVNTIIEKLYLASYQNTLTIADKLNYKDTYDKLDLLFFLRYLKYRYSKEYLDKLLNQYLGAEKLVTTTLNNLFYSTLLLDKKTSILNMLTKLWKLFHDIEELKK